MCQIPDSSRFPIEKGMEIIWIGDDFGKQVRQIILSKSFRKQLKTIYKQMMDRFKKAL
jgi:hypothetical protein